MKDTVKLGDIGVFVSGGTPSRKHPEYFEGTIPWVSTPALNGGLLDESDAVQLITEDAISNSATKLLPSRSLLIGIRVGVGKTAVNRVPMCTNQDIVAITGVDEARWDIRYVSYAVQAKSTYLVSQKQGATITGITSKLLKSLEIKQLDIGAQHSRVSNLDYVKKRISDCVSQRERLNELVKSRFVEMFGDAYGEHRRLEDCCVKVVGGKTPSMKHPEYYGGDVPFIKSGDVKEDVVSSGALWLSDEAIKNASVKLVPAGSVLVVVRSALLKRKVCTSICSSDVAINQDIRAFVPKPEFTSSYLLWSIRSHEQDLLNRVRSVNTSGMDMKQLYDLGICIAPIAKQQEFAAFVQQVDKLKFETQQAIDKLQMLYDSLAQEYFGNE